MHNTEKAIVFSGFSGEHPDDHWDRHAYPLVERILIQNVVGENIVQAGELLGLQEAPFRHICLINIALDVLPGSPCWNCSEVAGSSSFVLPKPCPELQDPELSSSRRWRGIMNNFDFPICLASFWIVKAMVLPPYLIQLKWVEDAENLQSFSSPCTVRISTSHIQDFHSSASWGLISHAQAGARAGMDSLSCTLSLPLFWDFISSLCIPFLVGFHSQALLFDVINFHTASPLSSRLWCRALF